MKKLFLLLTISLFVGCENDEGKSEDEKTAEDIWQEIQGYSDWGQAVDWTGVKASLDGTHGNFVQIWLNQQALPSFEDSTSTDLPYGSISVKEGYSSSDGSSINTITIMKNIFGLINYMKKKQFSKIVIGYDSRVCSNLFSRLIANMFLKNNFSIIFFDQINSLPELSFAVTHFKADMGIEITASHNDKRYNGYKLITQHGSPPTNTIREEISHEILNNPLEISYELLSYDYNDKFFNFISDSVLIINNFSLSNLTDKSNNTLTDEYLEQISNLVYDKEVVKKFASTISIGYSALHGTGFMPVSKLFEKLNITNVKYITKMIQPDSLFSLFDSKQILDPSDSLTSNVIIESFKDEYGKTEFDKLDLLCETITIVLLPFSSIIF